MKPVYDLATQARGIAEAVEEWQRALDESHRKSLNFGERVVVYLIQNQALWPQLLGQRNVKRIDNLLQDGVLNTEPDRAAAIRALKGVTSAPLATCKRAVEARWSYLRDQQPKSTALAAFLKAVDPTGQNVAVVELGPLATPSFDQLREWEAEGGCEAACPHGCWVEPDGICEHGHPSWLLKLGWI